MLARPPLADVSSSGISSSGLLSNEVHLRQVQNPELDWYRALYRRVGAPWLWFSRSGDEGRATGGGECHTAPPPNCSSANARGKRDRARGTRPFPSLSVEIAFFAVSRGYRQGPGTPFHDAVADRAWSNSATRVWLHTCTLDGPAALQFLYQVRIPSLQAGHRSGRRTCLWILAGRCRAAGSL